MNENAEEKVYEDLDELLRAKSVGYGAKWQDAWSEWLKGKSAAGTASHLDVVNPDRNEVLLWNS